MANLDHDQIAVRLRDERPWFEEARSSSELSSKFEALLREIDSNFFFNRNEAKWLRELWVLNEFAAITLPTRLRLNRVDPPDCFAQFDTGWVAIEITEILEPGRKRGMEYRKTKYEVEDDPVEDWVERAELIPTALREGIRMKKGKIFSAET